MRLRAPTIEDAPLVLAVLAARDLADLGVRDFQLGDILDEWRASDFDLADDAVVVESPAGVIVAYACVRPQGSLAVVAPDSEGQGIGSRLLQFAERRERERQAECHRQWIGGGNLSGRELLLAAGYQPVRSYHRMVISLDGVAQPPEPPPGVDVRTLDPAADAEMMHALDDLAFSEIPDYQAQPLQAFRELHLQAHDLAPDLSPVAMRGERLAGFALTRRWESEGAGFVDILCVHPQEQGHGLGRLLLAGAFARMAQAGLAEAQLGVASDNPRALGLYESAGMRRRFQFDTYERPITAGTGSTAPPR